VVSQSGIPHPNVYEGYDFSSGRSEPGNWLCLNMLRDVSQGSYSGWSGAYSVCSILVQLQSLALCDTIVLLCHRALVLVEREKKVMR
jgi:ubiquitin-protein ligase